MNRSFSIALLGIALVALANAASGGESTLIRLGGQPATSSDGISADGSAVVGTVGPGFRAFRFAEGMLSELGPVPKGVTAGKALAVSADGNRVVGVFNPPPPGVPDAEERAFVWTPEAIDLLPDLEGGEERGTARDISDDGTTIVGYGLSALGREAVVWTAEGVVGLGGLPGEFAYSDAWAVSADGGIVVGTAGVSVPESGAMGLPVLCESGFGPSSGLVGEAFRQAEGEMESLGHLQDGGQYSAALAVSPDGRIVVGESDSSAGPCEAFIWKDGVMLGLGHLPGGTRSAALDVSADGRIVVGNSDDETFESQAFIWDEENGMRRLQDVLVDEYDLPVEEWLRMISARGISDDGRTITGFGFNENALPEFEAFVVHLAPAPGASALQLAAMGALGALARSRARSSRS